MVAAEAARKAEQSPQLSPRTGGGEEAGDALERPGHVARIDISRGGSLVSVEELASGGAETVPGHAMGGGWCGDRRRIDVSEEDGGGGEAMSAEGTAMGRGGMSHVAHVPPSRPVVFSHRPSGVLLLRHQRVHVHACTLPVLTHRH